MRHSIVDGDSDRLGCVLTEERGAGAKGDPRDGIAIVEREREHGSLERCRVNVSPERIGIYTVLARNSEDELT